LRITSLRASSGPWIEFLEYLAPRDGKPYPPEEKANDLLHWQTRFVGSDVAAAAADLRKLRTRFISTGVVQESIVVRDPDGHAVQISQK